MNSSIKPILVSLALASWSLPGGAAETTPSPAPAPAEKVQAEAPGIGAWTTDYPAALKVAAERKLPIFIEFTGSDWCGWCQLMEKSCLSKPEFLEAMKTQCVLVSIDFPHKTKLPEALQAQNAKVAGQFKKHAGFPAYYIVDSDGKTVRWSFGAHPKYSKDLDLLISDIRGFCLACDGMVERAVAGLSPERARAYRASAKAFADRQQTVAAWLEQDHSDGKAAKEEFAHYTAELQALADKVKESLKSQS